MAASRAPQRIKKPSPVVKAAAPKPEAKTGPTRFFLISENKAHADSTAVHEWGWSRTKTGWNTAAGQDVRFLPDYDTLLAEAHKKGGPIGVYEGYRWYAVIAPHLLEGLVKAGSVLRMSAQGLG